VAGYGEFMILNNLSFKAQRGKITLLLGPNGAGKSTVLKTLFGLLKVRQGRVRLEGKDITGASAKRCSPSTAWPSCRRAATCSASSPSTKTWSSAASRWA
jgi:ABC-type branched-subunit amino acid transport system ATPase component